MEHRLLTKPVCLQPVQSEGLQEADREILATPIDVRTVKSPAKLIPSTPRSRKSGPIEVETADETEIPKKRKVNLSLSRSRVNDSTRKINTSNSTQDDSVDKLRRDKDSGNDTIVTDGSQIVQHNDFVQDENRKKRSRSESRTSTESYHHDCKSAKKKAKRLPKESKAELSQLKIKSDPKKYGHTKKSKKYNRSSSVDSEKEFAHKNDMISKERSLSRSISRTPSKSRYAAKNESLKSNKRHSQDTRRSSTSSYKKSHKDHNYDRRASAHSHSREASQNRDHKSVRRDSKDLIEKLSRKSDRRESSPHHTSRHSRKSKHSSK
ncbi:hypothetical protein TKK_0014719 [Trichogramma kaykai]